MRKYMQILHFFTLNPQSCVDVFTMRRYSRFERPDTVHTVRFNKGFYKKQVPTWCPRLCDASACKEGQCSSAKLLANLNNLVGVSLQRYAWGNFDFFLL